MYAIKFKLSNSVVYFLCKKYPVFIVFYNLRIKLCDVTCLFKKKCDLAKKYIPMPSAFPPSPHLYSPSYPRSARHDHLINQN